jgi:hypothetical protein
VHTVQRDLDLHYGRELTRKRPLLPNKTSPNLSKSDLTPDNHVFNEQRPRKSGVRIFTTHSRCTVVARILMFTLAGSVYSVVTISQFESGLLCLFSGSRYRAKKNVTRLIHSSVYTEQSLSSIGSRIFRSPLITPLALTRLYKGVWKIYVR